MGGRVFAGRVRRILARAVPGGAGEADFRTSWARVGVLRRSASAVPPALYVRAAYQSQRFTLGYGHAVPTALGHKHVSLRPRAGRADEGLPCFCVVRRAR